jgi:hypothetical protein
MTKTKKGVTLMKIHGNFLGGNIQVLQVTAEEWNPAGGGAA